ncbi:MAG: hypothetical protein AAF711_15450 [Planctomycetota bacterium]
MTGRASNTIAAISLILFGAAILGSGLFVLLKLISIPAGQQEGVFEFLDATRSITEPVVGFIAFAGLSAIGIGVRFLFMGGEDDGTTAHTPVKPDLGEHERPIF